ncbi:MAG: hypothetical protein C5B49_09960 [Bdellovibrio sp.]|nr:MAG: hypothetical protein C5B49_09960 [Bdellovibrio sp.]
MIEMKKTMKKTLVACSLGATMTGIHPCLARPQIADEKLTTSFSSEDPTGRELINDYLDTRCQDQESGLVPMRSLPQIKQWMDKGYNVKTLVITDEDTREQDNRTIAPFSAKVTLEHDGDLQEASARDCNVDLEPTDGAQEDRKPLAPGDERLPNRDEEKQEFRHRQDGEEQQGGDLTGEMKKLEGRLRRLEDRIENLEGNREDNVDK